MSLKSVNSRLRRRLSNRQGRRCIYCGRRMLRATPYNQLDDRRETIDHVLPRSKGGTNDPGNLVAACQGCNHKKADRIVTVAVASV